MNKFRGKSVVMLALLSALAAQQSAANQISAFGNVQFGDNKSGVASLTYGFGLQHVFSVGGTFTYFKIDDDNTEAQIGGSLGYRYYAQPGADSLFLGGGLQLRDFSEASNTRSLTAEIGYAWRLRENASFDTSVGYFKPKDGSGSASLNLGITVYLD